VASIPRLRAFAISLSGDVQKADDLVQETLLKAWQGIDGFEEGTNLKAWLFTILRNTFFSECRKLKDQGRAADGEKAAELAEPPRQQGHIDLQDLLKALAKLPPDQREALILVGLEGLSYQETACICGCEVGTVKSRVNRARKRLMNMLNITSPNELGGDATPLRF
jgi:RNA polymerase sigma-70 factor, ECF subfamily